MYSAALMGASMFIEDFCPVALQYRAQWFPRLFEVRSTDDPAGESFSPHGVATSAADVLRKHGVELQFFSTANRVDRRDMAIQTVAGYMRRLTPQGPAFKVTPQFVVVTKRGSTTTPVLVDGFEAGNVWDAKSTKGTSNPNTRRSLKDGYYDYGQNCVEYIALMFGPGTRRKAAPKAKVSPTFPSDPLSWMAV
jgi:hypothetical protein